MSHINAPMHNDPALAGSVPLPSAAQALPATQPPAELASITVLSGDEFNNFSIPAAAHTLDGFRTWALSDEFPRRGLGTFVQGELIVDMSPELYETHNVIKSEVSYVVYALARKERLGRFFSDRFLYSNEAAGVATEPDATFASFAALKSGRSGIVRADRPGVRDQLIGSPEWILEIVSRSSIRKDKHLLRDGYFRAGVAEYWLIDVLNDQLDFQLLVRGEANFVPVDPVDGWLASPTFGRSFRLTREKDDDGYWQYTLDMQENS